MNQETTQARSDRILVVDDTTANLQLLTNLLTDQGYTVHPASDGELALEFVQSTLPDLIFLDIRMPGMGGYEVCRRLKADERTRAVPVIFISILEDERDKVKGFQAGAVDYITKPFQPEEVLARIRTHLQLRDLTVRLEQKVAERTRDLETTNQQLLLEIAERKLAEKGLRASEERFRRLANNARDMIYRMSLPDGSYEYVSPAARELSGYPPEAFCSSPQLMRKILHPDWHGYFEEQWSRLLGGDMPPTYEYPIIHKSGDVRWWNQRNILVRDDAGLAVAIEGIVTDITERKRAEEEIRKLNQELEQRVKDRTADLEAANEELEGFTYTVSHDLRAPLRHIDGFIELLGMKVRTALDEQGRHYMDAVSSAAQKMGLLVDDLLSFSRTGRHAVSLQQVDLGTLLRDVIREFNPDTAGRNIVWRIGDLPAVRGDAAMLRIVLVNLISNALKFTLPREQVEIEIGCQVDEKETIIFIRDNGVGFDMAYVNKLFNVFQRLHHADEFEGTGIGLANVRRIISRHGGRTWAEGEIDQGATFHFSLPQVYQV